MTVPSSPPPSAPRRSSPTTLLVGVGLLAVVAVLVLLLPRFAPTDGAGVSPSSLPTSSDPGLGSATPTPDPSLVPPPTATPSPTSSPVPPSVLVGAGDIADCSSTDDSLTAALLDSVPGTVFTTGDNAYNSGTAKQFATCYDETWGRHRDRTRPATGNHDWRTADLAGYFGYFGAAAQGPGGTPWYSYELGSWHVIVLDSECALNGGCEADSAQGRWLAADLAASTADCTVAVWHKPRFSSGDHGNSKAGAPFWTALHAAGADIVLNGHDHDYERFAPQDPAGEADPAAGIRQFVVGTGGKSLRPFGNTKDHSEVRLVEHGVLQLTLGDGSYAWAFLSVTGDIPDRGTGVCH